MGHTHCLRVQKVENLFLTTPPQPFIIVPEFKHYFQAKPSFVGPIYGPDFYRPQRSCEGYVFTGVCLSTGGGGIPTCLAGGIPACLQQVSGGRGVGYPSMHCRWYPSKPCNKSRGGVPTTRGGTYSWRVCSWGVPAPGGLPAPGGCGGDPPPGQQTATVADGTHPTGMHSCLNCFGICTGKAVNSLIQTQHMT